MKKSIRVVLAMVSIAVFMFSCSEDPAPPVVEMFFEVDEANPYAVNFTTTSQNVNTYTWDFGDGETSTEANPSHTYVQSGTYSVKVTVTGEGGTTQAVKEVTISASMEEMISGGPAAANGKTWVLSRKATPGKDGAGAFSSDFPTDIMPGTDNLLALVGLEAEYDNEYTFHHDGSYSVNNVDGNNLAGWVYSSMVLGAENIVTVTPVGIFSTKSAAPQNAKWKLTEKTDLVVDAVDEIEEGVGQPKTVTFSKADYLTFENGGFIGVQDYAVHAIIREISADRMVIAVFMHSVLATPDKPSNIVTISFDAKK